MNILVALLRKEFLQIVRNKSILPIIVVMPMVQLLILTNAATFELRDVPMAVVDLDRSAASRSMVDAFNSGGFFHTVAMPVRTEDALDLVQAGTIRCVLVIPANAERDLRNGRAVSVQLLVSGEDGMQAGLIQAYASGILHDQGVRWVTERIPGMSAPVSVRERFAYNSELNYAFFMVPGILVLLITLIGMLLSALNVVREKEIGTVEQLNVTPVRRWQFIVAKLLPFWVIGLLELAFGLVLARLFFRLPIEGSLLLVFSGAGIYLVVVLAIGLLISTMAETQQQSMFIAWFFLVIFVLMSGLFTPIQSMPDWAQHVTRLNPLSYFIEIMRRVLLKGAGWAAVAPLFGILAIYATVMLTLAVTRYRKVAS